WATKQPTCRKPSIILSKGNRRRTIGRRATRPARPRSLTVIERWAYGMTANILIVEDEEPLALLLRYNLEAEGYEVDSAGRGDDADLRLRESPPDLAVIDWMLPGSSALELIPRVPRR